MSSVLPLARLRETRTLIAFHHPRPSHRVHVLVVPKKAIGRLTDLTSADSDFLTDVFHIVQELVKELDLDSAGYRLVLNGGKYQDVAQLHFHLISD